jgi:O-antigen ligase
LIVRWILFAYFLLSGVTWVAGQAGQGVTGRLALPDVFLLVVAFAMLATQRTALRVSRVGVAVLLMLMAFTPGVLLAPHLMDSVLEWAVYSYAAFAFFVIYNLVARLPVERRLEVLVWWSRAGAVLAVIGIYDLAAITTGLPSVAGMMGQKVQLSGGLVGTFRNTGQAGSFLVTVLAVALPVSTVIEDRRRKTELTVIIAILVLALVLSVKRAALLALVIGGTLFLVRGLQRRQAGRTLAIVAVSVLLGVPAYRWFSEASAAFRWRISNKLSTDAGETVTRFAESNFAVTREAFSAEPVFGVGLGTITAGGTEYELHSTYLNVLASTGLVGSLGYLVFIGMLFRALYRPLNRDPRTRRFARMFLPMLLGLMASYGYTNHLRKREFWITAALATALMAPEVVRRGRGALGAPPGHEPAEPPVREPELAGAGPPGR